jgi:hypothetical protein
MKVLPVSVKGGRVSGVSVMMEREYPFSLPRVFAMRENIDFKKEKKRGQNLTYRIHFSRPHFEPNLTMDGETAVPTNGTCEMQIVFGAGALKSGQEFTDKLVGRKTEKLLTKLLKFTEENSEDLAAYMTFGQPMESKPRALVSLIAKERNEHWAKNLRKQHKENKERVRNMMKELRADIAKAQKMQATKPKETT